jgi:hypothetical protein
VLDVVDEDVLGLDVAMGDGEHGEVVETSEYLVSVELDENGVNLSFFNYLVKVVREVVHHDVQVLVLSLVGQETILHD